MNKDFVSIRDFSPPEIQYLLLLDVRSRRIRMSTRMRSKGKHWR